MNVSYAGLTVGGSFGDWNDSDQSAGATESSEYWTLGASYEFGPAAVSATFLDSEFEDNEFHNIVLGADYQLAPGLVPYIEVSFFEFDEDGTDTDNEGTVVLIGTELTF